MRGIKPTECWKGYPGNSKHTILQRDVTKFNCSVHLSPTVSIRDMTTWINKVNTYQAKLHMHM